MIDQPCPHCFDRDDITERLIASEARNRIYERAIREMQELHNEDGNASFVAALLSRIEGLEANVERLSRLRAVKAA